MALITSDVCHVMLAGAPLLKRVFDSSLWHLTHSADSGVMAFGEKVPAIEVELYDKIPANKAKKRTIAFDS